MKNSENIKINHAQIAEEREKIHVDLEYLSQDQKEVIDMAESIAHLALRELCEPLQAWGMNIDPNKEVFTHTQLSALSLGARWTAAPNLPVNEKSHDIF